MVMDVKIQKDRVKRVIFILFCISFFLLSPSMLFARTTAGSMPWDSGLEKVLNALSGPTARVIGGIMILGGGLALAYEAGGQALKKLFWIIVGLGIAVNAPSILERFFKFGSGALLS